MRKNNKKISYTEDNQRMNRQFFGCSVLFGCLFIALITYLCVYVATNEETLFNNNYNSRQSVLAQKNLRGTIYASDGEILAQTIQDEAGNEFRQYPFANVFSHIVGYTAKGKTGLENIAGYYLMNTSATVAEQAENAEKNRKNPGNNIITTLDATLQQAAYDAMGIYEGAIVVMEPSTGKILAMVSKPDFDPNRIAEIWSELNADTENSVLLNRATQGIYPPGSTFKIVTALEYIRENPDSWENYTFQCNGKYTLGNDSIQCFHGSNHGLIGFERSFAKSCNSSFANMGMSLNRSSYLNTLNDLLINCELPVDLPYTESRVLLDSESEDADMMQTVIGQGATELTPLHMCMITSAIANNGVMMKPYEIESVQKPDGTIVKDFQPEAVKRIMTEEEADIMSDLMFSVVEKGTASKLSGLSYTAAGKTGSAEFNNNKLDSHAWFTGFAPAEEPQIAITVIIEKIGSGGDYAVPIARRVLDAYFE